MYLYGSAESVPVAVFCILNSLSQISFKEGKRGVGEGWRRVWEEGLLARSFFRTISCDFPMSLYDALFK